MSGLGRKRTFAECLEWVESGHSSGPAAPPFVMGTNVGTTIQTVGTVPPSMTNSAPWIAAARSEAR